MNRWKYDNPLLIANESTLLTEHNVRLYDGDEKTQFEGGDLILTTHRLLWSHYGGISKDLPCLTLDLSQIVYVEEEPSGAFNFTRSRKVLVFVTEPAEADVNVYKAQLSSDYNYVKLSFREGHSGGFLPTITAAIQRRAWTDTPHHKKPATVEPRIRLRAGIVGIERSLQEKQDATDRSISIAFQDLSKLMSRAKDMVKLSNQISTKIKEKHGHVSDDETVQFKSYLLSLGIDDPVTRDTHKSSDEYYRKLAAEISSLLADSVAEMGGMMVLTDVYCRVNRARGFELLSPEDCLIACQLMDSLGDVPLKLYEFQSGVKVLQLRSLDQQYTVDRIAAIVADKESITSEELSQLVGVSVTLAREQLLTAESASGICRDDSIEGLRFYLNRFLND